MANLYRTAASMGMLENAALSDTPVHRLHPRVKLGATLLYVTLVVSLPVTTPAPCFPFLVYPVFMAAASGTPLSLLLKRLCVALPFSLMGGVNRLFFYRETVYNLGFLMVSEGMLSFTTILLKTVLTVSAVLLLAATTPMTAIYRELASIGLPRAMLLPLELTGRYALVLLEEASAMRTAYALRAGVKQGIHPRHVGVMLGQLFLRAYDRAERIYRAMQCRNSQGIHLGGAKPLRPSDWIFVSTTAVGLLFLRFYRFF